LLPFVDVRPDGSSFDRSDEPIAASWQCLDISWRISRVTERITQALHHRVQAVLEIDEGVVGP
jgi:hypothetical protein